MHILFAFLYFFALCGLSKSYVSNIYNRRITTQQHKIDIRQISSNHALRTQLTQNAAVSIPPLEFLKSNMRESATSIGKMVKGTTYSLRTLSLLIAGIFTTFKLGFKRPNQNSPNQMESGWVRRGYGGSIARTIEVWTFVVAYAIKYVSFCS